MAGPYLNADTTFTRVEDSTSYVHVSANANTVLFQARKNKGRKAVIDTPLEVYQGPVVHDSEAVYWNYGTAHQTCLVHELRYLRRSMENEPAMTWNKEMESFITRMIHDFKTKVALIKKHLRNGRRNLTKSLRQEKRNISPEAN